MKKSTSQLVMYCLLLLAAVSISASCNKNKDKMIPPELHFKTDAGYTYADCTLTTNDTITVGVNAAKTEGKDLLTRFVVAQSLDGASSTTWYQESFNNDTYTKDLTIITRNVAGTEKYTFTIINRDGLVTSLNLMLTVN